MTAPPLVVQQMCMLTNKGFVRHGGVWENMVMSVCLWVIKGFENWIWCKQGIVNNIKQETWSVKKKENKDDKNEVTCIGSSPLPPPSNWDTSLHYLYNQYSWRMCVNVECQSVKESEVVVILSNAQGSKSQRRNNVPSEIIASNNIRNRTKWLNWDLPVGAHESTWVAQRSANQMTGEYHDFE